MSRMPSSSPSSPSEQSQSPLPSRRNSTPNVRKQQRLKELRQRNRELELVLSGLTHDLRTYLHTMLLASDGLKESVTGHPLDDTTRGYISRLQRAARRTRDLVHALLQFARCGQVGIVLPPVPLPTLIDECLYDLQLDIRAADAQVTVTSPLPTVKAEAVFLRTAVNSLLSNALKFVAPGVRPQVSISATPSTPGRWRLEVCDNGIGLSQEQQQRLFLPFKRLHDETTYPGLGLGLSTVRMIMEALGGRVGVDSTPGVGSIFWLDLAEALPLRGTRSDEEQ